MAAIRDEVLGLIRGTGSRGSLTIDEGLVGIVKIRRLGAGHSSSARSAEPTCARTTPPASWCAPGAGLPTRSATTSRCCWWTRPARRRCRRRGQRGVNTPPGGVALAALRLDDAELVEAGDPGGMLRQVASSAAQVRTALRGVRRGRPVPAQPGRAARARSWSRGRAGAGGAVFAGDALAAICGTGDAGPGDRACPGTSCPGWIGATDLVIAVSRSGHTAEAIALAGEAARRGCAPGRGGRARARRCRSSPRSARGTFIPVTTVGPARAMAWALTVPLLVAAARLGVARIDDGGLRGGGGRHGGRVAPVPPVQRVVRQPGQIAGARPDRAAPGDLGQVGPARRRPRAGSPQLAANAKYPAITGVLPAAGHDQVAAFDGPYAPPPSRLSRRRGLRRRGGYRRTDSTTATFDSFSDAGDDELGLDGPPMDEAAAATGAAGRSGGRAPGRGADQDRGRVAGAARGIDVSEIAMEGGDAAAAAGRAGAADRLRLGVPRDRAAGIDPLAIAGDRDLR